MKINKGERKERLLVQRGDASNSIGVLTKLVGSEAMLVFLRDYDEVLFRHACKQATS